MMSNDEEEYRAYQELPKTPDQIKTNDGEWTLEELNGVVYDDCESVLKSPWKSAGCSPMLIRTPVLAETIRQQYNMVQEYNKCGNFDKFDLWLISIIKGVLDLDRSESASHAGKVTSRNGP